MPGLTLQSVLPGKLGRLAGMEAAEIGHRLRERARCELERASYRLRGAREESDERFLDRLPPSQAEPPGGTLTARGAAFLDYLRWTAAPRFYLPADLRGRQALAERARRAFPGRTAALSAEAGRLAAHRFDLLGFGRVDCGDELDWHRDPVTDEAWERRFWADYDLVHEHAAGDPKRVHELGRHQHLPRLGKAWLLLEEERHAREAVGQMLGWIDQDPPGEGVHWHSSLEIALRALSWLWTLFFILPSRCLDEVAARRIGKSLFAQLDHVLAYPSVYSSPNTHLLGEAAALYAAGLVFSDCEGGAAWRDRGAELLTRGLERQVLPDGVHEELSTAYHAYALDFALQALALAEVNGHQPPPALRRAAEAMAEHLLHVAWPDGSLPRLGDDDGGRALALAATSYDHPLDLLSTAAVLFGRPDFKARAGVLREETLWLLGCRAEAAWEALPAASPGPLRAAFPEAGYFVQRSGWRSLDSQLLFDCGGLGRATGGHGHADALSVTLATGGRELLVDPGTYVYNGRAEWRDAFRSTRAHNTVVVDGRDQSEPGDTFRWRSRARARLLEDEGFDGLDLVGGEHDGYARPPVGVIHRRRVLYARPDYWLVLDDFRAAPGSTGAAGGGSEHTFDLLYHLAPEAETSSPVATGPAAAGLHVLAGGAGLLLFVNATAELELEVVDAPTGAPSRTGPGDRVPWVSRRYGEKRPAPVVAARFRGALPAAAVTLLVPYRGTSYRPAPGWEPKPFPVTADGAALGLEIDHPGGADLAVLAPGAPEVEGVFGGRSLRMAGEAFWARLAPKVDSEADGGAALRRLLAVRATRFEVDGTSLFESPDPVTRHRVVSRPVPPARPSLPSLPTLPRPPGAPVEIHRPRGDRPCAE